ncbi:hypothetical protein AKO1_001713 [Acrasis kona]|uniref:Uncharacterized protein n=1 Tax=Acrasis kona TaxID=1008807 RepID=A0AAW2YR90_9EUKA
MADAMAYAIASAIYDKINVDLSMVGAVRSTDGNKLSSFGGGKKFLGSRNEFQLTPSGSGMVINLTDIGKKFVKSYNTKKTQTQPTKQTNGTKAKEKKYRSDESFDQIKNVLSSHDNKVRLQELLSLLEVHNNRTFKDEPSLKSFVLNKGTNKGLLSISRVGGVDYVILSGPLTTSQAPKISVQPPPQLDQKITRRGRRNQTEVQTSQDNTSLVEPILANHTPQNDVFESMIYLSTPNGTIHHEYLQTLDQVFTSSVGLEKEERLDSVLLGDEEVKNAPQHGVLGTIVRDGHHIDDTDSDVSEEQYNSDHQQQLIHLNTHHPFCMVALGVQGSGKSHSMATVIESCMLHAPPYIQAKPSVTTMVFHYDQDPVNYCEALTLTTRRKGITQSAPVVEDMIVLVSPSFYLQRKMYYANAPNCRVLPLLFKWSDLNAAQIKNLMRVSADDDMPLYMNVILDLLRRAQKSGEKPSFDKFKQDINDLMFSTQQNSALTQRLQLIESLLDDSPQNKALSYENVTNLIGSDGRLIIVDLTDLMMSGPEANGIFQVVLSKFLSTPTRASKLALFDEAHKYLQPSGKDGLSAALVSAVRQMRHHGIRIAVSTQSPKVLPPELLELLTVALIHRFHSRDWFTYLQQKLSISDQCFREIMELRTGQALAFTPKWGRSVEGDGFVRKIQIRSRLTADGGVSRVTVSDG